MSCNQLAVMEFAPFATLRGSSTGVVTRVESLPLAAHLHHHCVRYSAGEAARGLRAGADGCFATHKACIWLDGSPDEFILEMIGFR